MHAQTVQDPQQITIKQLAQLVVEMVRHALLVLELTDLMELLPNQHLAWMAMDYRIPQVVIIHASRAGEISKHVQYLLQEPLPQRQVILVWTDTTKKLSVPQLPASHVELEFKHAPKPQASLQQLIALMVLF